MKVFELEFKLKDAVSYSDGFTANGTVKFWVEEETLADAVAAGRNKIADMFIFKTEEPKYIGYYESPF